MAYGNTRFGDVPRAQRASDPPGLGEGRQARNLNRRSADAVLDAATRASPGLWQAAPPRPADDFDRALDAVTSSPLFNPNRSRERLRAFAEAGHGQKPVSGRVTSRETKVAAIRGWLEQLSDEQQDEYRWSASYENLSAGQKRVVDAAYQQISDQAEAEYAAEIEYEDELAEDNIPTAQLLAEIGYEPVNDGGGYDGGYDGGWAA